MVFQTHSLSSRKFTIIEVGSFRIKVCVCEFKNEKVQIIAYSEKRSSTSYFLGGECKDIEKLAAGIKDAIKKTEKQNNLKIENIVINYPFGELFFYHNKLSYKRENAQLPLDKQELEKIFKKTEKILLQKCFKDIEKKSGYIESDLKLILSSITRIHIDKIPQQKIAGQTGSDMSISLINTLIPIDKNNTIKYIGEIIEKNIEKIIPTEFSLRNLFTQENIVIIYLGAIYTTITIKNTGKTTGISKIPIGINDLTQIISAQNNHTTNTIMKDIDSGVYTTQEQDFLDIWKQGLIVGMKDILGEDICPKNFYVFGDISIDFIEKSIARMDFQNSGIKLVNKVYFKDIHEAKIESQIHNCDDFEISVEIAAMIIELKNIIQKENSLLVKSLKKAVGELGYID